MQVADVFVTGHHTYFGCQNAFQESIIAWGFNILQWMVLVCAHS